jgi:hypothetical protein
MPSVFQARFTSKSSLVNTNEVDRLTSVSVVEEGEPVKMKPGDVVIQRGTMHAWSNRSDTWARMHFILIGQFSSMMSAISYSRLVGADPVALNGERLGAAGYSKDAVTSGGDVTAKDR